MNTVWNEYFETKKFHENYSGKFPQKFMALNDLMTLTKQLHNKEWKLSEW